MVTMLGCDGMRSKGAEKMSFATPYNREVAMNKQSVYTHRSRDYGAFLEDALSDADVLTDSIESSSADLMLNDLINSMRRLSADKARRLEIGRQLV